MSPYTMGITAHSTWKFPVAAGMGIHHAMNPDMYRGLWGGPGYRDCPVLPKVHKSRIKKEIKLLFRELKEQLMKNVD